MSNVIIGLGNTGNAIVKEIALTPSLDNEKLFTIDSVLSNVNMDSINRIHTIPIISDNKNGSGRNRQRGCEMFKFHDSQNAFEKLYKDCQEADQPIIVVTSAAGGTGSGACVPLCKKLLEMGLQVVPIIVIPSQDDPEAFHLNTTDLMLELDQLVQTYCIFRNEANTADYKRINNEIVETIEIILGKRYDITNKDSIDDSDLDVVLTVPGRFIAFAAEANDKELLKKELTRKLLTGFQPVWSEEESNNNTFVKAFSLTSLFADSDFSTVFSEINARIKHSYDEYRNICNNDNNGKLTATIIVSGLPRVNLKIIDNEYMESNSIGSGINKAKRPNFMNRKKASTISDKDDKGNPISKFKWN